MKTQKLWISALIVAGYCSLALDAIPVGNTNNKTVSETGSGGSINNATVDEAGNDITNATLHEIGSEDNIHNAVATVDETGGDSNNTKVDDVGSGGNINNATVDEIVEADENQVLFEGDIEISIEDIRKFYDLTKEQEKELMSMVIGKNKNRVSHVGRRAARSDEDRLWRHRTVSYIIDSSAERRRNMILEAINAWTDSTCLRFIERTAEDCIRFTEHNEDSSSSNIGREGGVQKIKLTNGYLTNRTIMHEIGHALGLWHEQSRPDRDSYVTVYWDNIQSEKDYNFEKMKEKEVDYQGTEYDYGSIMHYSRTAFLKNDCTGSCLTLNVSNATAFRMQDIPLNLIGRRNRLSPTDIEQVNRLYSCPGPGEQGFLTIYIRNGVNLEDTDNVFTGNPDAYVTVKAISSTGTESHRKTSYKQGTQYPTWNEWLLFSDKQWQFFRIRVWDNDISSGDDPMGMSETIPLLHQSRNSTQQKHCTNTACDRYIWFDYNIMLLTPVRGYLWVKVNYAHNLPDTDNTLNGDPDPYTSVRVIMPDGSSSSKQTTYIQGTRNPTWNQWLEMSGCDESAVFTVQVWDDDTFSDEKVLAEGLFEVASGHHTNLKHCLSNNCNSYLYLDYKTLIPREHAIRAYLHVKVRYAHNLPDTDNTLNGDPDPYVRVTAFWCSGSDSRETSYIQGTRYPSWNEWLGMGGCHNFVGFKAQVWDDDIFSDEEMFTPEPFEVALGSHSNITHCVSSNCLSYLYLDYKLLIPVYGYLRVKIRYAYNLPDADGFLGGDPDPYVHVTAFSCSGSISKQTHYIQGTKNPTWNRWLEMSGCRDFTGFKVQVWDDDDTSSNDKMSDEQLFEVALGSQSNIKHCVTSTCNSYMYLDYKLHVPNVRGLLRIKVRSAHNLPDADGFLGGDPDPYVRVTAFSCSGSSSQQTSYIQGTKNPTWNQWLVMSGCSKFAGFEVQVWDDDDTSSDDVMSSLEFFEVSSGYHSSIRHCVTSSCHSYLYLDYELTPDGNECDPNPCQNGGTCIDGCSSYSCSCTSSYTGDQCQYRQGRLTFYARYGSNLPDEDGWFAGDSDPYMKFVACDAHGNCYEKTSNVDEGDEDPEWHQHIDFGIRTWRRFEVSVWDDDGILSDDRLSNTHTWYLPSTRSASATFVTLNAYEGFVKFDYTYT